MNGRSHDAFAIDLGATYSSVAYIDEQGRPAVIRDNEGRDRTPSAVYFEGENNVVVGQVAKESAGIYPDQVVSLIKREMGDRAWHREFFGMEYTPPSISALILSALAKDAEADAHRPVHNVAITVPANFSQTEEKATWEAGEIAGLHVLELIPEPVAVAAYYRATGSPAGSKILVYDLGGSTFTVSLLEVAKGSVEVLATGGDSRLGGTDWDEKLFEHILEQLITQWGDESVRDDEAELAALRIFTERVKMDLSKADSKQVIRRYVGTAAKVRVTRQQFEEMTEDLLAETIRIVRRTLADAQRMHPGIDKRISQVLLAGGGSMMPAVGAVLRSEFSWPVFSSAEPDLAVAKGAALLANEPSMSYATVGTNRYRALRFDEWEYRDKFLKQHRNARSAPGDLMTRYAITLPATDAEIAVQVRAVRAYWNKIYTGKATWAQVAKLCRTEDERLRAEHGANMDKRAWWQQQQSDQQKAADASITGMADELQRRYGKLGVVSPWMLGQFAAKLSLTPEQANQAAERAGLAVITNVTLPAAEPIGTFRALLHAMSMCAVPSVPELVHPGAGTFRLVDKYECLADSRKRLDAVAVDAQSTEADKQRKSATVDARRAALAVLRKAVRDRVDLRDVALYHLVTIARDTASVSADIAAAELREAGLEAHDAAVIAVLVAEQSAGPGAVSNPVPDLLAAGRLREAKAAMMGLQAGSGMRAEATQMVEAAQRRLDQLLADARAALAVPDEARADLLLKEAASISVEDADAVWTAAAQPPSAMRESEGGTDPVDADRPNLLFRIYVPSGRLYAAEAERMLLLFRDWLGTVRGHGVRQSGYQTTAGGVYEFYGDQALTPVDMPDEFAEFSGFLARCAADPPIAAAQLAQAGLGRSTVSDVVARYGKEVKRLSFDLRQERERRILDIRHDLESELLDQGIDQDLAASQLSSLIEAIVPVPSAAVPLALLGQSKVTEQAVVSVNINQQFIQAAASSVIQNVQGTANFGPQAKELMDLVDRFGGERAADLKAAVFEIEDPHAHPKERSQAKDKLKAFLGRLGEGLQDTGMRILEKYIEAKIGL